MELNKDILAELDLAGLLDKREKAVAKQKEAATKVHNANADHLLGYWLGGCAMCLAAITVKQVFPEDTALGMLLLPACGISWLGMWITAFIPSGKARRLQEEAAAASRHVREIDVKIAFCHQVLEEAKKVKVRKYAEAWVEKAP